MVEEEYGQLVLPLTDELRETVQVLVAPSLVCLHFLLLLPMLLVCLVKFMHVLVRHSDLHVIPSLVLGLLELILYLFLGISWQPLHEWHFELVAACRRLVLFYSSAPVVDGALFICF